MKYFNIFLFLILLSSCSSFPLDKNSIEEILAFEYEKMDLTPKDAISFKCANNESFYIKYLEENNAVWVILKDREFRLNKIEGRNKTYANATTSLDITGNNAIIKVDASILYKECQNIEEEDTINNSNNVKKNTTKVIDQEDASNNTDSIQNDDRSNSQDINQDNADESSWLEKLKFWKEDSKTINN